MTPLRPYIKTEARNWAEKMILLYIEYNKTHQLITNTNMNKSIVSTINIMSDMFADFLKQNRSSLYDEFQTFISNKQPEIINLVKEDIKNNKQTKAPTKKKEHTFGPNIKKPVNAFVIFTQETQASNTSASKIPLVEIRKKWAGMSKDDKHIYQMKAKEKKIEYIKTVEAFYSDNPQQQEINQEIEKLRKTIKPKSAYILFGLNNRERIMKKHPKMTFSDISKELSTRWKYIQEHEQDKHKKYIKIAEKLKDEYETKVKRIIEQVNSTYKDGIKIPEDEQESEIDEEN